MSERVWEASAKAKGYVGTTRVPSSSWATMMSKIKAEPWEKSGTIQSGGETEKGGARLYLLWEERSVGRNQTPNLHQM